MDTDREARRPVLREHSLPPRLLAQRRGGRSWVERERELALLAAAQRNRLRARDEAELPEELPPAAAEAVARAGSDERLEPRAVERRALRQLPHPAERPAPLALSHERIGLVLAKRPHV